MAARKRKRKAKPGGRKVKPKPTPSLASFAGIVALWPSAGDLARQIGRGLKPAAVTKWGQRDSIPSEYWRPLAETQFARSRDITIDLLAKIAERGRA